MYPPRPDAVHASSSYTATGSSEVFNMTENHHHYDEELGQPSGSRDNLPSATGSTQKKRTTSWDLLSGVKKLEHSYEQFDSRHASQAHLVYADGDVPKNRLAKLYNYLLNVSIVTRWILFIVPILGILWIPGILSLTTFPKAQIWGVKLIWWSIWLSICWGGWWAALAVSRIAPVIIRSTLGVVAVGTRRYIDWLQALQRYIAFFAWCLAISVSWIPIIKIHQENAGGKSVAAVDLLDKLLLACVICAGILLFEKFFIQWIAAKFHERSYADRIAEQKFAVRSLVTLYKNSVDIPGRTDTLRGDARKGSVGDPRRFLKKIRDGVRSAATATTSAFGNVASEIAGSSVLQPNSPQAVVKTALESANKSRLLARRLFYSFAKNDAEYLLPTDIERFFPTQDEAYQVFALFDKDLNGDASRDEIEMACSEFHREQLSIEHSMRDLDSAVGRLDNILMSVYVIVVLVIIAVALEAQLVTVVTGAGTLVLGLSWLIGGSLQEVLTSIIFLFVKHPFDVGDRVSINKEIYTVKEIRLLSTVFLDSSSVLVQAPNSILKRTVYSKLSSESSGAFMSVLCLKDYLPIIMMQMSETFTFDVSYGTSFEDLEKLREKMLDFVVTERRDYHPIFDVSVKDFPDQERMTLSADIKYKSNGQIGALKAKRRNKWICALKAALTDMKVYGPKGNPDAPPSITRYTKVPYEIIEALDHKAQTTNSEPADTKLQPIWDLQDKKVDIVGSSENIFGDPAENAHASPRQEFPEPQLGASHARPGAAVTLAAMNPPI